MRWKEMRKTFGVPFGVWLSAILNKEPLKYLRMCYENNMSPEEVQEGFDEERYE
tara:strand:+ start:216 stop:377 length:162 start_codon:yes stop_codon:yes gene_type:complete